MDHPLANDCLSNLKQPVTSVAVMAVVVVVVVLVTTSQKLISFRPGYPEFAA